MTSYSQRTWTKNRQLQHKKLSEHKFDTSEYVTFNDGVKLTMITDTPVTDKHPQLEMFEDDKPKRILPRHDKPKVTDTITLPECPIAAAVAKKVVNRAEEGMKTYGQTMARTDIDTAGWIDHTVEELLDAAAYLTRLKQDLQERVNPLP